MARVIECIPLPLVVVIDGPTDFLLSVVVLPQPTPRPDPDGGLLDWAQCGFVLPTPPKWAL